MKQFFGTVLICFGIAFLILRFPSCQPQDKSNCTWDVTNHTYICPDER